MATVARVVSGRGAASPARRARGTDCAIERRKPRGSPEMSRSPIPDGVKVLTVGEISRNVKSLLEEAYPSVWVSGEVSNVARPTSGHVYLKLKDSESQLQAVLYRAVAL